MGDDEKTVEKTEETKTEETKTETTETPVEGDNGGEDSGSSED